MGKDIKIKLFYEDEKRHKSKVYSLHHCHITIINLHIDKQIHSLIAIHSANSCVHKKKKCNKKYTSSRAIRSRSLDVRW